MFMSVWNVTWITDKGKELTNRRCVLQLIVLVTENIYTVSATNWDSYLEKNLLQMDFFSCAAKAQQCCSDVVQVGNG